jgi:hypothetical protein
MSRLSAVLFVLMLAGLGGAASASAATAGGAPGLLQGVACTAATQCTAVETGAGAGIAEVTFNPFAPGRPTGVFLVSEEPNSGVSRVASGVACPSATQCTLIGYESPTLNTPQSAQVSLAATFNPAAPGAVIPVEIPRASDPTFNFASGGIACPATNQCTAVAGQSEVSFNPTAPGSPVPTTVASGNSLRSVACPSTTQCTAVGAAPDGETGTIVTFNPSAPGAATATAAPQHPFVSLACPLTTQCTAADGLTELTFNPMAPATQTQSILNGGNVSNHLFDVQCPSTTQCTAAGFGTTVGTGNGPGQGAIVVTFNPAAPGSPTPSPIDSAQQTGIACPSTSECTIIDSQGGELTFNPAAPGTPTPVVINALPGSGGGSGGTAATQAALASALVPSGKAASITAILRAGGFTYSVVPPGAGTLATNWWFLPPGARLARRKAAKPILVASGHLRFFFGAGRSKLKVKLTSAGRRLLKHATRLKLTSQASFAPTGSALVRKKKAFTLKR